MIDKGKPIKDFEGRYNVTKNGDVLSVKNRLKVLTQYVTKQGVNLVTLTKRDTMLKKSKAVRLFTSQLVAQAFLKDYPIDGKNHKLVWINGIKTDDRAVNLKLLVKRPIHSSEYRGVTWNNAKQKWVASMIVNKKKIILGEFEIELDASKCYEKALDKKKLKTMQKKDHNKIVKKENKILEFQH